MADLSKWHDYEALVFYARTNCIWSQSAPLWTVLRRQHHRASTSASMSICFCLYEPWNPDWYFPKLQSVVLKSQHNQPPPPQCHIPDDLVSFSHLHSVQSLPKIHNSKCPSHLPGSLCLDHYRWILYSATLNHHLNEHSIPLITGLDINITTCWTVARTWIIWQSR